MGAEVTARCACGDRAAAKFCGACALAYCAACCARRHAKGAFAHHAIAEIRATDAASRRGGTTTTTTAAGGGDDDHGHGHGGRETTRVRVDRVCDECDGGRRAVVTCTACELHLCAVCVDAVHRHGSMQAHAAQNKFVDLNAQEPDEEGEDEEAVQADASGDVDRLLQDASEDVHRGSQLHPTAFQSSLKHTSSPFFTSVGQLDGDTENDPDQELSPTPPTKASPSSSSAYDLWGSWNVRAFGSSSGDRSSLSSPPLSGADEWKGFQSLSIDESRASPPLSLHGDEEIVPLSSLTKSLRSLSFASNEDEREPTTGTRSIRPRSFSDYTSLGSVKLHDIWNERVPQLQPAMPSKPSPGLDLYRSMKTSVASRHVIVRSHAGAFDNSSVRSVVDTLNGYGPVASIREEFARDGVLFCTFFQLKAAIGAVKLWFTNSSAHSIGSETSAHFSIPYEAPNEINCATLRVQIIGPTRGSAFSDMRQLCSRYGEVASVLERDGDDMHSSQYLVEFNDARDVATAISRMAGALLPSGHMISASRSHPPTFDAAKVHTFQECVESSGAPVLANRPKSFSEGTSILTSPSSTSSSPLHSSLFDPSSTGFGATSDAEPVRLNRSGSSGFIENAPDTRSPSPFAPSLPAGGNAWRVREAARPRSSSAFASLSTDSSSSLLADAFSSSPARSTRFPPPYRSPASASTFSHQSPQAFHQNALLQGRLGPIRSGSDPGFRDSYSSSVASSTSSVGRNDQGTGEYSLSIEKVARGEDKRTTLMVRNIPNKYTQQMLLAEINAHHHGKYDFFYLPIDFKNKCNMGYAFINFIEAESIVSFYQEFDSQKWTNFNSEKVCAISYARLQGKQAMITRFQNSSLLEKHESYRPLVFFSTGPNQGKPEPFPAPKPQHAHPHHFVNKKPHHPSHHHQAMMASSDEYLLAAHTGRLYAHQQQQQLHAAHVLHGHALLANAHAAAAAMLHTIPGLGMPPAQYAPPRAHHYSQGYQQHYGADRRHGQTYPASGMPSRPSAGAPFGGFSNSGFAPSSS